MVSTAIKGNFENVAGTCTAFYISLIESGLRLARRVAGQGRKRKAGSVPYSAIKVANEFLRLAQEGGPPHGLTPLQLIKLVYIAHGWSLVYLRGPLLNEPAQAWQYGPVIPSLYNAIRSYRASPVCRQIDGDSDPQPLSAEARQMIKAVYDAYGKYSGVQLSNMTHQPSTPWSDAWNSRGKNAVIPDEDISRHYALLSAQRANAR